MATKKKKSKKLTAKELVTGKSKVKKKAKPKNKTTAKAKAKAKPKEKQVKPQFTSDHAEEAKVKKLNRGTPPKYSSDVCDFLPYMFDEGQSVREVCRGLGIASRTFYKWKKEHPEFARAADYGLDLSQAYWEETGRLGSRGSLPKGASSAMWIYSMKNRFPEDWKDTILIDDKDTREAIADMIDANMDQKAAEELYFKIIKRLK